MRNNEDPAFAGSFFMLNLSSLAENCVAGYQRNMTTNQSETPLAVDAPETDVTPMTLTMLSELLAKSKETPRLRILQKLHKSEDDRVHRMFNAMQPGTYITPHRHLNPAKNESIMVISGAMMLVRFDEQGEVVEYLLLQPGTETFGVDVAPHVYHTFIVLKPDTVVFEVKDGPYSSDDDKDFAPWAPREGEQGAMDYQLALIKKLAEESAASADEAEKAEAAAAAEGDGK